MMNIEFMNWWAYIGMYEFWTYFYKEIETWVCSLGKWNLWPCCEESEIWTLFIRKWKRRAPKAIDTWTPCTRELKLHLHTREKGQWNNVWVPKGKEKHVINCDKLNETQERHCLWHDSNVLCGWFKGATKVCNPQRNSQIHLFWKGIQKREKG